MLSFSIVIICAFKNISFLFINFSNNSYGLYGSTFLTDFKISIIYLRFFNMFY